VTTPFRILAISGSLRAQSSNTEILRAAGRLAAPRARVVLYDGLGTLPHFNPDLDGEGAVLPPPVRRLRDALAASDALLICSPEYAHGVPGTLKNALDWLVSGPEMVGMPVGLLNASSRATFAAASLAETLRTMSADVVPGACVTVPLDGRRPSAEAIAATPAFADPIAAALQALAATGRAPR